MPAAFTIRVLESIIRIEFDRRLSADVVSMLRSPWRGLEVDQAGQTDATIRVRIGEPSQLDDVSTDVVAKDAAMAAQSLATAVTLQGISHLRGRAILLHAAAAALDDGRVVGFIGPSGRGKTTASRELAQKYGYVTDETLAVRLDLSVIPYPKPLSVVVGPPPKHSVAAADLGMRAVPERPLKLAALALLERRPGVSAAYVESVHPTQAVALIAAETSGLIALQRPLGDLIGVIQQTGGVRRVVYGDASQLTAVVPDILAANGSRELDIETVPRGANHSGVEFSSAQNSTPDGVYRRARWSDAVRIGDRVLIHDGVSVILLEGLGPTLWLAADGRTQAELTAAVIGESSPPPGIDAKSVIADQLDALVQAGLLISS